MKKIVYNLCISIGIFFYFAGNACSGDLKPKIAFIPTCESSTPYELREAVKKVSSSMDVDLFGLGFGYLPSAEGVDLSSYDLVFLVGNSYEVIKIKEALEEAKKKTTVVIVSPTVIEGNVDLSDFTDIEQYYFNRSEENFKRLMVYLGTKFCGLPGNVEKPIVFPNAAIYHPDAGNLFESAEKYIDWYGQDDKHRHVYEKSEKTIGILFHRSDYTKENVSTLNELIRTSEKKGCNVVAFYSKKGYRLSDIVSVQGEAVIDVLISLSSQLNYSSLDSGIAEAKKINVPILYAPVHYYKTRKEWEEDSDGLGLGMISELAYSELNGMFEPILIGTKEFESSGKKITAPITDQLEWRIDRAISWASLSRKNNQKKKIAIPYYSEGGGKGNLGADIDYYLNAQASIVNLFKEMSQRGYDLGSKPVFDDAVLSSMMAEQGGNIGVWDDVEIRKRVENGNVELIGYDEYMNWFSELDKGKQTAVIEKWGPAPGNIMVYEKNGEKFIVIPKIEFGNVVLLPHPTWGFLQDEDVLYSDSGVPPHHQYIAFWYWINRKFEADAVISIFTQISLMPGKQRGLSANDWGGLLLQNVPNIHPFPVQANSGLHNKRRANALVIDYMPTIVSSELYEELLTLKNKIELYESPQEQALKDNYAEGIVEEVVRLKLDRELKLDIDSIATSDLVKQLNSYLDEINKEHMPYGPHILGEPPEGEPLVEMIFSMLGSDYKNEISRLNHDDEAGKQLIRNIVLEGMPTDQVQQEVLGTNDPALDQQLILAQDYARRIKECENEIPRMADALEAQYILPGPMDDPIRNPESLPTGRNPQGLDARTFPTEESWEAGKTLVDQMLAQHLEKNGNYPNKVAFVLWSSETTKNHGVLEAQILYLLGVKPVWSKSRVKDVELISSTDLKRPRIDVVITASGLYRDHFQEKIVLLDKAVRLASEQDEKNNYVRENSYFIEKELRSSGYDPEKAKRVSTARIFSEALGAYSPSIQFAVPAGDTWDSEKEISDLYMSRVSHIYGENFTGEAAEDVFTHNLKNVDAGIFSRSSNVYGVLEHPMVAAYFGGLKMAVRNTSGKSIDMYITNLRDSENAKVETLDRFYNRELRSRYFNPKWIKGMMEHGYDGARYMETFSENMWVWDVTSPDMVTEENWNSVYEVYVEDKYDLETKEFFDENNPYALQSMVSTMLEVKEKGYWHPSKEVFENLVKVYAESVAAHGISGAYGSTDEAMHKDVTKVLENIQDLPSKLLEDYEKQIAQYSGKLEQIKGYEVTEVENEHVDEDKFRPQLGFFVLLAAIVLIAFGLWRGNRYKTNPLK